MLSDHLLSTFTQSSMTFVKKVAAGSIRAYFLLLILTIKGVKELTLHGKRSYGRYKVATDNDQGLS